MTGSKITRAGAKNVVLMAGAQVDGDFAPIRLIGPSDVHTAAAPALQLKLDQIIFAVQSGLTLFLHWEKDGLLLPLEGRGLLNYYPVESLQPTTAGQALFLSGTGKGCYHLVLDFTKQG